MPRQEKWSPFNGKAEQTRLARARTWVLEIYCNFRCKQLKLPELHTQIMMNAFVAQEANVGAGLIRNVKIGYRNLSSEARGKMTELLGSAASSLPLDVLGADWRNAIVAVEAEMERILQNQSQGPDRANQVYSTRRRLQQASGTEGSTGPPEIGD